MAKILFYISLFFLWGCELSAQNLVINSSFEKYSDCPTFNGQMYFALTVSSPPTNQAEYFNSCSTNPWYSVPYQGNYNYQEAHFGDAYVGIYIYSGHREYVQMEMFGPLVNGKYYNVEFWTNRQSGMSGCGLASNNICLAFKSNFIDTSRVNQFVSDLSQATLYSTLPDIVKFTNPIITDTANWVKINGVYKADGTENYLIIGNFFYNTETATINMQDCPCQDPYSAYYNIDDVLVEEITQPFWQYHDTTVYYGDSVLIGPALTGLDIDWYTDNLDFISNAPGIYVTPPMSRDYIAKETFDGVETEHVVHVTVIGGAGLEENELQNVRVFPNPSKGSFSISGITSDKPLQLEVHDVHGKLVFEEKEFSKEANGFALDVENGIYFVTVSDLESKSSVVEKLVVSR